MPERAFKPSIVAYLPFNRYRSSHFVAIVAVMEVERMADETPKVEFHEFQEYGPQNNASPAKLCVRRSDTEVGMVTACHLGGRLGVDMVASVGLEKCVG